MSLVAIRVDRCKASQGVIVDAGSWQRCSPVSAKLTQLRGGLGEKVECKEGQRGSEQINYEVRRQRRSGEVCHCQQDCVRVTIMRAAPSSPASVGDGDAVCL
jgi:hypothetical protein